MIGVIQYDAGNITSVCNALNALSVPYFISNDKSKLNDAERLIMPGVGEAHSAMESLARNDLVGWLRNVKVPFLGICLGMQLLFEESKERNTKCLGIIRGTIQRFENNTCEGSGEKLKIPHMGWNTISMYRDDPLFSNIPPGSFFYFVHSYYAPVMDKTLTTTVHGTVFSSSVRSKNFYGVQFHPEKSAEQGLHVLRNFINLC